MKVNKKYTAMMLTLLGLSIQQVESGPGEVERLAGQFGETVRQRNDRFRQDRNAMMDSQAGASEKLLHDEAQEWANLLEQQRRLESDIRSRESVDDAFDREWVEVRGRNVSHNVLVPAVRDSSGGMYGFDRIQSMLQKLPNYVDKYKKSEIRTHNLTNLLDYFQDEKTAKLAMALLEELRDLTPEQKMDVIRSIKPTYYS